jgi:hypothetical protein
MCALRNPIDPVERVEAVVAAVDALAKTIGPWCSCPCCGAPPARQQVRDYDPMWGDGKVYCLDCGAFVRDWDRD